VTGDVTEYDSDVAALQRNDIKPIPADPADLCRFIVRRDQPARVLSGTKVEGVVKQVQRTLHPGPAEADGMTTGGRTSHQIHGEPGGLIVSPIRAADGVASADTE
jgi:hypothetical protein